MPSLCEAASGFAIALKPQGEYPGNAAHTDGLQRKFGKAIGKDKFVLTT